MTDEAIPDEIWEKARNLRCAVVWQSNASVEPIARALMAERREAAQERDRLLDLIDERTYWHHLAEEQAGILKDALETLIAEIDGAYPPETSWTARAKSRLRDAAALDSTQARIAAAVDGRPAPADVAAIAADAARRAFHADGPVTINLSPWERVPAHAKKTWLRVAEATRAAIRQPDPAGQQEEEPAP